MGYLSFIIVLGLTCFCLWQLRGKLGLSTKQLFIGWSIKLGFGFSFVFIFSHYYGNGNLYGDAYNFINDSQILNEFGRSNPLEYFKILFGFADETTLFNDSILAQTNIWSYGENGDLINDNRLIIRINSLIHFISFGNTYVHVMVMAFLSYIGILLLYTTFRKYTANKTLFFFLILSFPSIAFWGSGITKEAILLFAFGIYFFGLFKLFEEKSIGYTALFVIGGALLLFNKPHIGLIALPLSSFLWLGKMSQWRKSIRYLFPIAVLAGALLLTFAPSRINLLDKVSYKQRDLINMGKGGIFFVTDSAFCAFDYTQLDHFKQFPTKKIQVLAATKGEYKLFGKQTFHPFEIEPSDQRYAVYLVQPPSESYVDVTPINYQRSKLLTTLPEVLFNTTIRPLPWDPGSPLKLGSFGTNMLFFAFVVFVLFNRKKLSEQEKYFLIYFVLSALLILLLIGWTTPILGAIVRYKIAAELFILIGLSILLKPLRHA